MKRSSDGPFSSVRDNDNVDQQHFGPDHRQSWLTEPLFDYDQFLKKYLAEQNGHSAERAANGSKRK